MSEHTKPDEQNAETDEQERNTRRDFLKSLGRWSAIIIGGAALGDMLKTPEADAAGWVNGGGGGWVNARGGGGGGSWVNRSGGGGAWVNGGGGGGSWVNRGGGWINGGGAGWVNRRSSWVNRH